MKLLAQIDERIVMKSQLTLTHLLERAVKLFESRDRFRRTDNWTHHYTYRDFYRRARALAAVLQDSGIRPRDRVARLNGITTFAGLFRFLPLRCAPHAQPAPASDELVYIINHADYHTIVDDVLLPLFEKIKEQVNFERIIIVPFSGKSLPHEYEDYEQLLQESNDAPEYATLREEDPAAMCYTSGTTGRPKGVVYSHRALALHSYSISLPDNFSISRHDTILPAMSMFHANAWGLPFAGVMNGSRLVLPGPNLQPELILDLLSDEQVTLTGAVPTVWLGVLDALEKQPDRWPLANGLRVVVAGSACPEALFGGFEKFGVCVIQPWGMTETTPIATVCTLKPHMNSWSEDEKRKLRAKQGLPSPFIEVRAMDDNGEVSWDGETPGELEVRGPFVAESYYKEPNETERWREDGWFRTGDVATIDPEGYVKITDRIKDLIKSGGEWISSIDVENALVAHEAVAEAAVIAVPHPKWQERPLAIMVLKDGAEANAEELRFFLASQFAKWQLPAISFSFRASAYVYREAVEIRTPRHLQGLELGHTRCDGLMLTRYRVDNVPWALRPFYLAGAWALGLVFYLYYCLCRATSQISLQGPGNRDLSQHAIFCLWHESWWLYFVVFLRRAAAHTMINHPAAYMKPIHVVLRLMGMKRLLFGSSGEEGRQAANEVARLVKKGYSTTIAGRSLRSAAGPEKGVLHMALQSG
jgi:fatty-acyl-CoA synthase